MKKQLTEDKFLSALELEALNRALALASSRDRLLIELALATGARATELLNITLADLDASKRSVAIRGLKGSRDRSIPLPAKLFNELLKLSSNEKQKPFSIGYDRLDDIWKLYTPTKGKTFHCLRHTRAVLLLQKAKDIKLVQYVLGHKNLNNTLIYTDIAPEREYLRKALA